MEQGIDIENRSRSPSELSLKRPASSQNLLRSSVSTQSISVSSSNELSAKDAIRVFKDKAATGHFLAKSCSLSTFATSTSAFNSSFAKPVVLGIAINEVIPKLQRTSVTQYDVLKEEHRKTTEALRKATEALLENTEVLKETNEDNEKQRRFEGEFQEFKEEFRNFKEESRKPEGAFSGRIC